MNIRCSKIFDSDNFYKISILEIPKILFFEIPIFKILF